MTLSRGFILSAAVCAALLAAGPADAKASKKKKMAPPVAAAPAAPVGGAVGMPGAPGSGAARPGPAAGDPWVLEHFDAIDADRNGQLSRAEITAWIEQARARMRAEVEAKFKAADTDGDGRLSPAEAGTGMPRLAEHFEFLDANRDGFVTLAELDQLRDRDAMRQRIVERVKQADTDKDGKLNLAEVQVAFPGMASRFAQLDRDGDGFLTPDDFRPHPGGF